MSYRPLLPDRKDTPRGTVYLLHFDPPFKHARRYIGFTTNPDQRFEDHLRGTGANLVRHALAAGCAVQLAAMYPNVTVRFEIKLKNRGGATKWCPVCRGGHGG